MLVAYEDGGLQIKDFPMEETRAPLRSIRSRSDAVRIRKWAMEQRPEIQWVIEGNGPYGVRESLSAASR